MMTPPKSSSASTWARRLRRWLFQLTITYGVICGVLAWNQRSFVFHPTPARPAVATPEIVLQQPTARIRVATRVLPNSDAVIYFGGNAEDVSYNYETLAKCFPESSLYLMNYRGYGGSSGEPSEVALHEDARALLQHVATQHSAVTVIGRSLGSGVAVRLVADHAEHQIAKLILLTPFDSITNVARSKFPWLPVNWLLVDRFESNRFAAKVTVPTLILVAEHDAVVPRPLSDSLVRCFTPGLVRLVELTGTDHDTITNSRRCWELLSEFAR